MNSTKKTILIIGAGPAGLTAAMEILRKTDMQPIILETSKDIGGISKTVRFKNNRMDIGGHRFFSKSDEIIDWWLDILPLEENKINEESSPKQNDDVMLVRKRISRILYNKNFFDYPITLSIKTLTGLGLRKIIKIGHSYVYSRIFVVKEEKNLEDFFINRFGKELYLTFFKSYTEKVWGKKCTEIGSDWGKQRIKGLSVSKTIIDAITRIFRKKSLRQKNTETSLIEYFMYPKYGPGHMWETVADKIKEMGGKILTESEVIKINKSEDKIESVEYVNHQTGTSERVHANYFFSTMPIDKVFAGITYIDNEKTIPSDILNTAINLEYRNFITIGVLVSSEKLKKITDNWIYIHEPDVHVGRIQFFHNWSEYMIEDKNKNLLGLEYFCNQDDYLWNLSSEDFKILSMKELLQIGLVDDEKQVLDFHVEKVEKAYPVYSGTYSDFDKVKEYLNSIKNFYPIGRNGMHRYNNQDHSMLTAKEAADQIISGEVEKSKIWDINIDDDYHEQANK
ncbi:MAG: NAD(P)/FAD-dependent oxidoreductase [bacterium]